MAYPLPPEAEDAIEAGRMRTANLVDFYLKTTGGAALTLRCWNWPGSINFPGSDHIASGSVAYESMYGRIALQTEIRLSATLAAEPLRLTLDGSRSGDDEDFTGRFVDSDWHQARMRVRKIQLETETLAASSTPVWEWRGRLDYRQQVEKAGEPTRWDVTCEGGLFRVRGRRLRTRSHNDQQRRAAGDTFYLATAKQVGQQLIWARKPATIVGAAAIGAPGVGPAAGTVAGILPEAY